MNRIRLSIVMALVGVGSSLFASTSFGQDSGKPTSKICEQLLGSPDGIVGKSGATLAPKTVGVFDVCYDGDQWKVQPPPSPRITNLDAVWITSSPAAHRFATDRN